MLARQMEVYAGFLEHTDHHVGRLVDALDGPRRPRRHARLLHHRRQRRLRRGHASTARSTRCSSSTAPTRSRRPSSWRRRIDEFGTPDGLQPLRRRLGARHGHAVPVDQAGRLALGRHPQRHHRALAERHHGQGRGARQFHHVIDVAPTVLEAAGLPEPTSSTASQQKPLEGVSMAYTFDDARRGRAARDAVLRDVLQPRHLPQGLDRGHPPQHAVGDGADCPPFDDDVWELYDTNTDWTQAHDLAAEQPEKLAELQRLFLDRGRASTTCCRSTTAGSSGSTPTSPAGRCWSRATRSCCSAAWAG